MEIFSENDFTFQGHHLLRYQKRLDGSIVDACPGRNTSAYTIKYITEDYTANNHTQYTLHEGLVEKTQSRAWPVG